MGTPGEKTGGWEVINDLCVINEAVWSSTPKMMWTQNPALDWVSDLSSCLMIMLKIIISSLGYIDSIQNIFCHLPFHKILDRFSKSLKCSVLC